MPTVLFWKMKKKILNWVVKKLIKINFSIKIIEWFDMETYVKQGCCINIIKEGGLWMLLCLMYADDAIIVAKSNECFCGGV